MKVAERVNAMANAKGIDLKHGPCADKHVIKSWKMNGWVGSEHGKGEETVTDLAEMTYGHVDYKGHCY